MAVVDDDSSVREAVPDLLPQAGCAVHALAWAKAFLTSDAVDATSCLGFDAGLAGMSGPDLQQKPARRGIRVPTVFITAKDDTALQPRLLAAVRWRVLKPFNDRIDEAVEAALERR